MMAERPPLPPHPRDAEPFRTGEDDALGKLLRRRGYTIREWREISRCQQCGHPSWDPDTDTHDKVMRDCGHGCGCVVLVCMQCGHYDSGFGAAGCPCDDGI